MRIYWSELRKWEETSIQECTAKVIQAILRKCLLKLRRLMNGYIWPCVSMFVYLNLLYIFLSFYKHDKSCLKRHSTWRILLWSNHPNVHTRFYRLVLICPLMFGHLKFLIYVHDIPFDIFGLTNILQCIVNSNLTFV